VTSGKQLARLIIINT